MANDLTFLSFIATIILYIRAMRKTESLGHPVESLRQVGSGRMGETYFTSELPAERSRSDAGAALWLSSTN